MKKKIIISIIIIIFIAGAFYVYKKYSQNILVGQENKTYMSNPASSNCIDKGGKLNIEKRGDRGEYGLCVFENNMACEEWALLRGDCQMGGVDTSSFKKIEEKYCLWLGNKLSEESGSDCMLLDGSKCPIKEFYNGKCPILN